MFLVCFLNDICSFDAEHKHEHFLLIWITACTAAVSLSHDWLSTVPIRGSNWTTTGNTHMCSCCLGYEGKHPTSQVGSCAKIAGFGVAGPHFRAIFTLRHSVRLSMCLVMGPGRREEARSRCYKYIRFKLDASSVWCAYMQCLYACVGATEGIILYWPVSDSVCSTELALKTIQFFHVWQIKE